MQLLCIAFVKVRLIVKNMSWYAVARGRNPGVYRTWRECEKHVKNFSEPKFRKFSSEEEAINFVNEHGKKDMEEKNCIDLTTGTTSSTERSPPRPSTSKTVTGSPGLSSPKLKANALKQRLALLEKKYEDSMLDLRIEIDTIKENVANFDLILNNNIIGESERNETFKTIQECLSTLASSYRISVEDLKSEIEDLKQSLRNLESEIGQSRVNTEQVTVGSSSVSAFKRNLFKEAVLPVPTKRLYSSSAGETSRPSKRKKSTDSISLGNNLQFEVDDDGYVHVYTDGACEKNGKVGAKAGVGVWFGDNHPLNYSEPVQGRTTNNTAEIEAATCAVDLARKAGIKNLLIHTDSQFLINCITIWIHKWKKKDWKIANGDPVKNKEELIALEQALEGMNVRWNHVRGHRGNHGNEMADELARKGAKKRR